MRINNIVRKTKNSFIKQLTNFNRKMNNYLMKIKKGRKKRKRKNYKKEDQVQKINKIWEKFQGMQKKKENKSNQKLKHQQIESLC